MLNSKLQTAAILMVFVLSCNGYIKSVDAVVYKNLPTLNDSISPLAPENQLLLFKRVVAAFDQTYTPLYAKTIASDLANDYAVYYLRQQLQALIDMWRATGNADYLDKARIVSLKAITDASASPKPLLKYKQTRGVWPCFFSKDLVPFTGGHGQLYDFQGAAGLMMIAVALREKKHPDANTIADFVEQKIVTKWLQVDPAITDSRFKDNDSNRLLLAFLDGSRDKREHFACICIDLDKLGYNRYPYRSWAEFLVQLYIGHRSNLNQAAPDKAVLGTLAPNDWGVIPNKKTGGLVWYWINEKLVVEDTSHANRTVWLATRSYSEKWIDATALQAFINTFKYQVWDPKNEIFYFNNNIDGNDTAVQSMGPGKKGNIWFGWHRLAAYDSDMGELFISIAYDLTNGGPNIPDQPQNKAMEEAPPCLFAWAARLISPQGKPEIFP